MTYQYILCPHKKPTERFYTPQHSLDVHISLIPPEKGLGGVGLVLCHECATMTKGVILERFLRDVMSDSLKEMVKHAR